MSDENETVTDGTPASGFTWRLEANSFNDALVELLRGGDRVSLRVIVDEIARDLIAVIPTCEPGQRTPRYPNRPPHVIKVEGTCDLTERG